MEEGLDPYRLKKKIIPLRLDDILYIEHIKRGMELEEAESKRITNLFVMEVNFKPSPGLILVAPRIIKPKETRGKSDIIMPEQARGKANDFAEVNEVFDEWPYQADVIAVGEALPNIPVDVEIGDLVYLTRELSPRDAVLVGGKVCATIRVSDIHGKVLPVIDNSKN